MWLPITVCITIKKKYKLTWIYMYSPIEKNSLSNYLDKPFFFKGIWGLKQNVKCCQIVVINRHAHSGWPPRPLENMHGNHLNSSHVNLWFSFPEQKHAVSYNFLWQLCELIHFLYISLTSHWLDSYTLWGWDCSVEIGHPCARSNKWKSGFVTLNLATH